MQIDISIFTSNLGIIIQILAIIGALIPAIKYLDRRFEQRVNEEVKKQLDKTCKELDEFKLAFARFEVKINTAIEYINRATMKLQSRQDDRDIANDR